MQKMRAVSLADFVRVADAGDMLVQETAAHRSHHHMSARYQRAIDRAERRQFTTLLEVDAIQLDGVYEGAEQFLFAKWLQQELKGGIFARSMPCPRMGETTPFLYERRVIVVAAWCRSRSDTLI